MAAAIADDGRVLPATEALSALTPKKVKDRFLPEGVSLSGLVVTLADYEDLGKTKYRSWRKAGAAVFATFDPESGEWRTIVGIDPRGPRDVVAALPRTAGRGRR